ncbi:MAG: dTMP kinase [Geobacter sp.]|nr:dTMP kinase [Geobacter sp.]
MGYFITFEGVEGSGKSTQIRFLADELISRNLATTLTREPGGCPIADQIRAILLDADNSAMSAMSELMLYAAARAQHVNEVVAPALADGNIVLCDRFCDATVAYQSYGRGLDRAVIDTLNKHACSGISPDLTILIDCDPQVGLARARRRIELSSGPREERFELETVAFHQRVRSGYNNLAKTEPQRFVIIDGADTIENIASKIRDAVLSRIPEGIRAIR